jgi:hypothetical protein
MIVFPELIKWGRLGNQLFEMATTIALAVDHNDSFGFNRTWQGTEWPYFGRFPIDPGSFKEDLPPGPEYREPLFHYSPIPYQPSLRLFGYFFTERYFAHHASLIRALLTPYGVPPKNSYRKACSVHVRRGDYLHLQDQHPVLPMRYYERAGNLMQKRGVEKFLVFSDDPEWCRAAFGHPFEVMPPASDTDHLAQMIACEHHIVANSTFSWWAAWLDPNPDKVVARPSRWFGPVYSHDEKDLWPSDWIRVEVADGHGPTAEGKGALGGIP